jgi:hypothetical protein
MGKGFFVPIPSSFISPKFGFRKPDNKEISVDLPTPLLPVIINMNDRWRPNAYVQS